MALSRGDTPPYMRQLVLLLATAGLVWLLLTLAGVLAPFVLAAILAYISNPLVVRLVRLGSLGQRRQRRIARPLLSRPVASAIVLVLFLLAFIALAVVVAPLVVEQAARIAELLPRAVQQVNEHLLPWLNQRFGLQLQLDLAHLSEFAKGHAAGLQEFAGKLVQSLTRSGVAVAGLLMTLLLVPVVLYYLLVDWDLLLERIEQFIPRRWHATATGIAREIDAVLGQFLRGQLSVMLLLAAYYSLALTLAGIEFALPVGLLTGLLIFIPYAGYGLGLVLALLTAALQGGSWLPVLLVLGIYGAGQLLESFLLTPFLVGEKIGLHPVVVIFALLAFGQLFGFFGVLIALPASAALVVALRHASAAYLASDTYRRM